ncbi:MAG TPA: hypothetical protein VIT91_02460 [Chthoniobacterales bacterium]
MTHSPIDHLVVYRHPAPRGLLRACTLIESLHEFPPPGNRVRITKPRSIQILPPAMTGACVPLTHSRQLRGERVVVIGDVVGFCHRGGDVWFSAGFRKNRPAGEKNGHGERAEPRGWITPPRGATLPLHGWITAPRDKMSALRGWALPPHGARRRPAWQNVIADRRKKSGAWFEDRTVWWKDCAVWSNGCAA